MIQLELNSLDFFKQLNEDLKQIENKIDDEKLKIINYLQEMQKIDISFQYLTQTQLNKTMIQIANQKNVDNQLDKSIIKLSQELLRKWKKQLVDKQQNVQLNQGTQENKKHNDQQNPIKRKENFTDNQQQLAKKVKKQEVNVQENNKKQINDINNNEQLLDKRRQGTINCLKKAIEQDFKDIQKDQENQQKIKEIVKQIEDEIFNKHQKQSGQKYIDDCRLLISTIQKQENKCLRNRIMIGEISISQLVACKPEVLLDQNALQQLNQQKQLNMQARRSDWIMEQYSKHQPKEGGGIICIKCKSNNTMTRLVQTRGADEPMTEFNTCYNCGKTWKF